MSLVRGEFLSDIRVDYSLSRKVELPLRGYFWLHGHFGLD